jgi:hypothetical protein
VEGLVIYQTAGLVDDYEREDSPAFELVSQASSYRTRGSVHTCCRLSIGEIYESECCILRGPCRLIGPSR